MRDIPGSRLHTDITAGGLLDGWRRLAQTLLPWYEQIGHEARAGEALAGTLVTDFWGLYDSVAVGDNQRCLPHLLRERFKVDEHNGRREWKAVSKQLKRLVRDGMTQNAR